MNLQMSVQVKAIVHRRKEVEDEKEEEIFVAPFKYRQSTHPDVRH